jgi:hypothetical protein
MSRPSIGRMAVLVLTALLSGSCSKAPEEAVQAPATPPRAHAPVLPRTDVVDLSNEPVGYIGHGAMFDRSGKEIAVTPEFADQVQEFYLEALLRAADEKQRGAYEQKRQKLFDGRRWDARSAFFIRSALIAGLVREARLANPGVLLGKTSLLNWRILGSFKPPRTLERMLVEAGLVEQSIMRSSTTAGGAAYVNACSADGVPTPPDWGTSQWVSQGTLTDAQEFISASMVAEVFTWESSAPEGMCIALPRSNGNSIGLLGIICLGKASGKACFWDNQQNDNQFPIQKGTVVPLSQFAGGGDLEGGSGGVCTSCHAGENPYVIHPGTNLGTPKLGSFPLKADGWYDPMVHPSWPQNPGPTNILASVPSSGQCTSCHTQPGPGGRFPKLSTALIGYCGTILPRAIARTMPPGNPNDPNYAAHANALIAACNNTTSPVIRFDETVLDYRDVELGFSFAKALVIHNDGDAPLTFTVTNPSGGDPDLPHWPEINLATNQILNPGDPPAVLRQTYRPGALGTHTIQLQVTSNDGATPSQAITLTGTGAAPIPINSVLVLDRSGSMAGQAGDRRKIDALRDAANLYSDLLRDDVGGSGTGDKLGFVKYNHDNSVYMNLEFMSPAKRTEVQDKLSDAALGDGSRLQPSGETGIGGAMETAAGVLGGPLADRKQVMVVLTDGIENRTPSIGDVVGPIQAGNANLKMYSVGLGTQIEPSKLQAITNISSGYHQVSSSLSGVTLFDLEIFYFKIFANATDMDLVVDPTQVVNLTTPDTITVDRATIITSDRSATFLVLDDPVLRQFYDLEFVSPTGQVIVPGVTIGGIPIQEMSRRTYRIYRIVFPDISQAGTYVGDWLLRLRPNGKWSEKAVRQALAESSIGYSTWLSPYLGLVPIGFAAAVASDYRLQVQVLPSSYLPGAEVTLTASLTDRGWPAPQGNVDVTVTTPNGATYPMTLFDDGTHGDLAAGDARWSNRFQQTAVPKVYKFLFHSVGQNERGELAPREATRYVTLMQPEPEPTEGRCLACWLVRALLPLILLLLLAMWYCTCFRRLKAVAGSR